MYSTLCSPVQPTGYADFTTEVPQSAWQFIQHVNTDFLTVNGVPLGAWRLHLIGCLRFSITLETSQSNVLHDSLTSLQKKHTEKLILLE